MHWMWHTERATCLVQSESAWGKAVLCESGCWVEERSPLSALGGGVDSLDVETLVQAGITHKQSNQNTGRKDLIMRYASEKVCG